MTPQILVPMVLLLLAGMLNSVQGPTNALLARGGGSVLTAALVSFLVGTSLLLAAWIVLRPQANWAAMRALPPYAWIGGLYGAIYVAAFAFATPRLGIAAAIVIASLGQLGAALAIDHFALLGVPRDPIRLTKALGVLLVVAGIGLVRWK
ncbi:DMT family transporter [Sphingomonas jatrophae]|uniref:Transporter family-2 protein n=1 Tax=Sphingomonas jatrophae TaxID=1166337 RepID=A0A1I6JM84_9SPHN|nr:DMT family transporter [Sphingomonas jatrophae]SFR80075.1 transporter family-2 protein [Sphingomonas jatrophae]